jgi:hypothetical protein
MEERVTLQGKAGRSTRTNPLDERIHRYESIGDTQVLGGRWDQERERSMATGAMAARLKSRAFFKHQRTIPGWLSGVGR